MTKAASSRAEQGIPEENFKVIRGWLEILQCPGIQGTIHLWGNMGAPNTSSVREEMIESSKNIQCHRQEHVYNQDETGFKMEAQDVRKHSKKSAC